jgi:homoserine dehydrogenase
MIPVAIVGVGLVGRELVSQLTSTPLLRSTFPIVAITNSRHAYYGSLEHPITLTELDAQFKQSSQATEVDTFLQHILKAAAKAGSNQQNSKEQQKRAVIVDCTASDTVAGLYPLWCEHGCFVVTPNKKAFSGDYALFKQLQPSLASSATPFCPPRIYHESSVGAGLPVISTLNDIVRTGDNVHQIEGILSGTLSYLFNAFSPSGTSTGASEPPRFSDIVKRAKNAGYTVRWRP